MSEAEKYEALGREFMRSLDVWDEACEKGNITPEEERRSVMWETIRKARELGLLEENKP